MQTWKTRSRKTVLNPDDGRFLKVEYHEVELPDGTVIPDWPWVVTPDYINVVLINEEGQFVCFRQTKYAVEGTSLAIVGGYLDSGEDGLTAAKREVLEETGFEASDWIALGSFPVDGNRGAGIAHFFLAQDARKVQEIKADDLEEQEMLLLSRAEVEAALHKGEFKVLPWAAIVALALNRLG